MGFQHDLTQQIVNVHWPSGSLAELSLLFSVGPTAFYADGTPTVVTLSTSGLPALSPASFQVNSTPGLPVPPFFPGPYYGGTTELTMPDGESATLTAGWGIEQLGGIVDGFVDYRSQKTGPGSWHPFLGNNIFRITITINLRPLDFLGSGSAGNHFEWQASAGFVPAQGDTQSSAKTGKAGSSTTLIFQIDAIMEPPSFIFSVGGA